MSNSWHWHSETESPYLTTRLLERWPHGFFTRLSWPSQPPELNSQLDAAAKIYRAKQVHGNRVLSPEEFDREKSDFAIESEKRPEADAVITSAPHQAVWVCSADCTPVLIADEDTQRVAAIHAGWRGTALRIVPKAIEKMQAQGSQIKNLRIAMGPAIAGEVYQVTTHVAAEVGRSLEITAKDDEDLVTKLMAVEDPPILPDAENGRLRLDVRRINTLQLLEIGIQPEHIDIAPYCTYQTPEKFFSYRRTHEKKVQWSGIVSR